MTLSTFPIIFPPGIHPCPSRPGLLSLPRLQHHHWVELGEDAGEELDAKLSKLRDMVHPNVRIIYFAPDKRKEGGAYRVEEGEIKRIDDIFGEIEFTNGAKIPIKRIIDVET